MVIDRKIKPICQTQDLLAMRESQVCPAFLEPMVQLGSRVRKVNLVLKEREVQRDNAV